MSYAAEELRYEIVELFDDATRMSRYRVARGELPLRIHRSASLSASGAIVVCALCDARAPDHRCPELRLVKKARLGSV